MGRAARAQAGTSFAVIACPNQIEDVCLPHWYRASVVF